MISKVYLVFFVVALASVIESSVMNRGSKANNVLGSQGTLIVGGRPALQGEAPYQLEIRQNQTHLCGASLVEIDGFQVGVTAAHCVVPDDGPYNLVAGDINRTDISGTEQLRTVHKVFAHQNYSVYSVKNDIALLFFNMSFQLNENIKAVPLPIQGQVTSQGSLKVSGWGDLEYNGESPDILQIVEIPLVNDSYCQSAYQDNIIIPDDNMICAGSTLGDVSPCQGDSGGPAISEAGYLAGIVSWGQGCGHPDYPAVFTKVASFVDWIRVTVLDQQNS